MDNGEPPVLAIPNVLRFPRAAKVLEFPAERTQPRPVPGQVWRHYQGRRFVIISLAVSEENDGEVVIFRDLDGTSVWTRQLETWYLRPDGKPRYKVVR